MTRLSFASGYLGLLLCYFAASLSLLCVAHALPSRLCFGLALIFSLLSLSGHLGQLSRDVPDFHSFNVRAPAMACFIFIGLGVLAYCFSL